MFKRSFLFALLFLIIIFSQPVSSLAHEAYVLSPSQLKAGYATSGPNIFLALQNPDNLRIFLIISFGVAIFVVANFIFRHSQIGKKIYKRLSVFEKFSPLPVRVTVAISLFYSAYTGSFLGPEIPLASLPFSDLARVFLYLTSFLFLFGFLTEIAAVLSLAVFVLGFITRGSYLITYFNYFGEFISLLFFGSRLFSFDRIIFGRLKRFVNFEQYEGTIIRVSYGIALSFAAISVKFFHPLLPLAVVKEYNLTQFHLLFPQDPLLLVLGAAICELAIGLFIILGFQTRLVVLISLFYITLSLLFFKEAVWPHLILYGISFNLLLNDGGKLSLDNFFDKVKIPLPTQHLS